MEENNKPTALQRAEEVDLEVIRYKEELAKAMGLPSSYQMGLLKEVCRDLIESGFAPTCFKQNPLALYLCALRGREMNIGPLESIMETFWVAPGNKIGLYANKMLALMHKHGVSSKFLVETKDECRILFTPKPPHEPYEAVFHFEEARVAGLVKPDSNWFKWPNEMNKARAISRGWRALAGTFAGTGANLYTPDEIAETEEVTQAVAADTAPPPEVQIGVRKKAKAPEPVVTVEAAAGPDPDPAHSKESVMKTYNEVMAGADPQKRFYTTPPADKTQAPAAPETQAPVNLTPTPGERAARPDIWGPKAEPKPSGSGPTEVSATPSETSNAARDRLTALYPKTPGKTAEERKKNAHSFLSGWFGINNPSLWPKNAVDRQAALDALEKAIAEEPAEVLLYKAHQTGAKRRERSEADDSADYYTKLGWGDGTRMAAKALKRRYAHSGEDFVEFCQHFGLNKLPEADAAAFLAFATAAGRGNSLLKQIRELSTRLGDGYGSIVGSIEQYRSAPITDIPVADLEHYFQRVTDRLNAEAPPSSQNTEEMKAGS